MSCACSKNRVRLSRALVELQSSQSFGNALGSGGGCSWLPFDDADVAPAAADARASAADTGAAKVSSRIAVFVGAAAFLFAAATAAAAAFFCCGDIAASSSACLALSCCCCHAASPLVWSSTGATMTLARLAVSTQPVVVGFFLGSGSTKLTYSSVCKWTKTSEIKVT